MTGVATMQIKIVRFVCNIPYMSLRVATSFSTVHIIFALSIRYYCGGQKFEYHNIVPALPRSETAVHCFVFDIVLSMLLHIIAHLF